MTAEKDSSGWAIEEKTMSHSNSHSKEQRRGAKSPHRQRVEEFIEEDFELLDALDE